ncbi:MAG: 50S ribosomal protein L1 [Candidatus Woesearchaeota archaeon]
MDKDTFEEAVKRLKADSKKRNFTQRIDLIVNLKNLNLKKPEDQVDFYAQLPHNTGRKRKVCALVGPELSEEAKVCDEMVQAHEFEKFQQDKKSLKALTEKMDFFVAQANIMPKVAQVFGRVLGPRGKMPNPKAGCVVPPKGSLKPLYDRLQDMQRIFAKTQPLVQVPIGSEGMSEDEVAENAAYVYDQLLHHLTLEKNNIRSVYVKMTMSRPERIY